MTPSYQRLLARVLFHRRLSCNCATRRKREEEEREEQSRTATTTARAAEAEVGTATLHIADNGVGVRENGRGRPGGELTGKLQPPPRLQE